MQQMWRNVTAGLFLGICSWQDIQKRSISAKVLLFFGLFAVFVDIFSKIPILLCMTGLLPGIGLLILGKVSGQKIGYGDGFVVTVIGLLLYGKSTVVIFLSALFLCACSSIVFLCAGKMKRKAAVPFIPFLAAGFVYYLLCGIER